jgi:hypothetical protein
MVSSVVAVAFAADCAMAPPATISVASAVELKSLFMFILPGDVRTGGEATLPQPNPTIFGLDTNDAL